MSALGDLVRDERERQFIGLRELARRIDRSPTFVSQLETWGKPPKLSEETARRIADVLDLDADAVILMAGHVPSDARPETSVDVKLFRAILKRGDAWRAQLLTDLGGW